MYIYKCIFIPEVNIYIYSKHYLFFWGLAIHSIQPVVLTVLYKVKQWNYRVLKSTYTMICVALLNSF